MEKRVGYMDILKGLSIITVVMSHASLGGVFFSLFYMQLFFFVSGYFYKEEYTKNSLLLVKNRLRSLYIPFLKYGVIFLILHNLFYKINFYSIYSNVPIKFYTTSDILNSLVHILLFDNSELLLSPLWFLTDLFIINILLTLILLITENIKFKKVIRGIIIILLFFIGIYFTKIGFNLKYSINNKEVFNVSFVALLFFYLGFRYKEHELKINLNIIIAIISLVLLLVSAKYHLGSDMRINYYPNVLMSIATSLSGIYFMIYLSKRIDTINFKVNNILEYIGKNTIIILSLHITCFKIIEIIQIIAYKLPMYYLSLFSSITINKKWNVIYVMAGLIVPICIQKFIIDSKLTMFTKIHERREQIVNGKR